MILFSNIIVSGEEKFYDGGSSGDSYCYLKFEAEFRAEVIRSGLTIINMVMIKRSSKVLTIY